MDARDIRQAIEKVEVLTDNLADTVEYIRVRISSILNDLYEGIELEEKRNNDQGASHEMPR